MIDKNQEILKNALRLLTRARSMKPQAAALYLAPLAVLVEQLPGQEAKQANDAVSRLLETLRSGADVSSETWDVALTSLRHWRASFSS